MFSTPLFLFTSLCAGSGNGDWGFTYELGQSGFLRDHIHSNTISARTDHKSFHIPDPN
jgi:hypothetical protein